MKKIIISFYIILIIFNIFSISYATENTLIVDQQESLKITSLIKEGKIFTEKVFPDIDFSSFFEEAIKGNIDNSKIFSGIFNLLGGEVKNTLKTLITILIIIVVNSLFRSISDNFENKGVANITYYVQYILIVTIILTNFTSIVKSAQDSINHLVDFSNMLLPILMTLLITTGNIVSANIIQPVILFATSFIGNMISILIIPIMLVSTTFNIISNISDKVQINKISSFFKSSIVWVLGVMLTVFIGLLSLEGTLSSSVDGLTAKTTKAAISSFIPIVGKLLGDSIDTVLGCASILKNAIGIFGVLIVIGICIVPIIKTICVTILYSLASAIAEPIADGKIVKLLEQMSGTFKMLLAILCTVSVMLIIGITLVVKISNTGLMYR